MIRGTPPPSVPEPTVDGYYWIRLATPRYVHVPGPMNEPCRSYSTWNNPVVIVELVEIDNGMTNWMGSDEGQSIEGSHQRLVEVISKVEKPL